MFFVFFKQPLAVNKLVFLKECMPAKLRNSINEIENKNNFSYWATLSIFNYCNKKNPLQSCDCLFIKSTLLDN